MMDFDRFITFERAEPDEGETFSLPQKFSD